MPIIFVVFVGWLREDDRFHSRLQFDYILYFSFKYTPYLHIFVTIFITVGIKISGYKRIQNYQSIKPAIIKAIDSVPIEDRELAKTFELSTTNLESINQQGFFFVTFPRLNRLTD